MIWFVGLAIRTATVIAAIAVPRLSAPSKYQNPAAATTMINWSRLSHNRSRKNSICSRITRRNRSYMASPRAYPASRRSSWSRSAATVLAPAPEADSVSAASLIAARCARNAPLARRRYRRAASSRGGSVTSAHRPSNGSIRNVATYSTSTSMIAVATGGPLSRSRSATVFTSEDVRVPRSPRPACSTRSSGSPSTLATTPSRSRAAARSPNR